MYYSESVSERSQCPRCGCRVRVQFVTESVPFPEADGWKMLSHPRVSCDVCEWEDKGPRFDEALARYEAGAES